MKLRYECSTCTHVGLRRKSNQDAILVSKEKSFFSVADGLGGHLGGEVASSLALSRFHDFLDKSMRASFRRSPIWVIRKAYNEVNKEIYFQSQKHAELRGMGTTLVMMWVEDQKVYIGNIGDSRAYLFRDNNLWQLTDDHTLGAEESKKGFKIQEEKVISASSNTLTQSVGFTMTVRPDIIYNTPKDEDVFLLCSDGLHGMVSDDGILEILRSENLKNVPKKCTIKALSEGGFDNISVVVVKVRIIT